MRIFINHSSLCHIMKHVMIRLILPFTQVIDCGGLIYFASTDLLTIESPNYPNPYPPNLHCSWSVHGTHGSTIKGTFISFQLHTSSASLAVYDRLSDDDDDATRILSATGFVIPPSFTASQAIEVVFTTGPITQQSGGFSLVLVLTGMYILNVLLYT